MVLRPVRYSKEKASKILIQTKWILIVNCALFIAFGIGYAGMHLKDDTIMPVGLLWILSILIYLVWVGRLARGMGRSAIYNVFAAWLGSSFLLIIAYILVFAHLRKVFKSTYPDELELVPA